jgi:uncharacterized protein YdhG (YjbR/CyaY superfamily)
MSHPDVEAYLSGLPADQRDALEALRKTIAAAAPEAEEGMSYGAPAFRYRTRPLVTYAASKGHCSFFPMSPDVLDGYRDRLADFGLAKGTVRFTPERPIPDDIVAAIVRDRIAELDAAARR